MGCSEQESGDDDNDDDDDGGDDGDDDDDDDDDDDGDDDDDDGEDDGDDDDDVDDDEDDDNDDDEIQQRKSFNQPTITLPTCFFTTHLSNLTTTIIINPLAPPILPPHQIFNHSSHSPINTITFPSPHHCIYGTDDSTLHLIDLRNTRCVCVSVSKCMCLCIIRNINCIPIKSL